MKPTISIAILVGAAACLAPASPDLCDTPDATADIAGLALDRRPAGRRESESAGITAWFERVASPAGPAGSSANVVSGRATYPVDDAATTFAAVAGALVSDIQCRGADQSTVSLPDTTTGADGGFVLTCPDTHPAATGTVSLTGEFASVAMGAGPVVNQSFDLAGNVVFPRGPGRTFATMAYIGPIARQRFGVSRPAIRIALDVADVAGVGGRYRASDDRIDFGPARLGGSEAEQEFFLIAHEYGHAFHYVAIEPWASYRCEGGIHAFRVANTLSCAFVEGFAHFFAAWIGGGRLDFDEADVNFASDRVIEENLYRSFNADGARTPGMVAAFLYDVADDAGSPDGPGNVADGDELFDPVSVPGTEIARLIRQCQLTSSQARCPVATALDGIDQFIYCAEAAAGPGLGRRWRSYQAIDNGGRPDLWNPAAFRLLWGRDLFPAG